MGGFKVQGLGFQGLGFTVWGVGFQGLGFQGFGVVPLRISIGYTYIPNSYVYKNSSIYTLYIIHTNVYLYNIVCKRGVRAQSVECCVFMFVYVTYTIYIYTFFYIYKLCLQLIYIYIHITTHIDMQLYINARVPVGGPLG